MIRPATEADIPTLLAMSRAMVDEAPGLTRSIDPQHYSTTLKGLIAAGGAFLGCRGESPVGFALGAVASCWYSGQRYGFDLAVYIRPEDRGLGHLAVGLVQALEAMAVEQGAREMVLGVSTGLPMAERLYAGLGYQLAMTGWRRPLVGPDG